MNTKFMDEEITKKAEEVLRGTKDLTSYKQAMAIILLNSYSFSVREAAK